MILEPGFRYVRRNETVTQVVTADFRSTWYDPETHLKYTIGGDGRVYSDHTDEWDLVRRLDPEVQPIYDGVTPGGDSLPPTMPADEYRAFALKQGGGVSGQSRTTRAEYLAFVRETFDHMVELIEKKNRDYCGPGDDPFANFRRSTAVGVEPINGLAVRFLDKVARIESFLQAGKLENESFEDAWLDAIGYSCLALGMLKEGKRVDR